MIRFTLFYLNIKGKPLLAFLFFMIPLYCCYVDHERDARASCADLLKYKSELFFNNSLLLFRNQLGLSL
jgi:hypothetical protein